MSTEYLKWPKKCWCGRVFIFIQHWHWHWHWRSLSDPVYSLKISISKKQTSKSPKRHTLCLVVIIHSDLFRLQLLEKCYNIVIGELGSLALWFCIYCWWSYKETLFFKLQADPHNIQPASSAPVLSLVPLLRDQTGSGAPGRTGWLHSFSMGSSAVAVTATAMALNLHTHMHTQYLPIHPHVHTHTHWHQWW